MNLTTTDEKKAALQTALAVCYAITDTIKEMGEAPAGVIYAALMQRFPSISLGDYQNLERTILNTKLVKKQGDLLIWVGPDA